MHQLPKIISIYGPTITKKTGLAVYISKYIWGKYNKDVVIINADSRKAYKDLDIGQVKIDPPFDKKLELKVYRYLNLDEKFSLKDYQEKAFEAIDQALKENKMPILLGGTGVCQLAVLENWNVTDTKHESVNYSRYGKKNEKYDYIILSPIMPKEILFSNIAKHIKGHLQTGIFYELKDLIKKYNIDYKNDKNYNPQGLQEEAQHMKLKAKWRASSYNVLYETIGYREFLEYAIYNDKDLQKLSNKDNQIIERSMNRNLKNMARKQIRFLDSFNRDKLFFVRNFVDSRVIVDKFLK